MIIEVKCAIKKENGQSRRKEFIQASRKRAKYNRCWYFPATNMLSTGQVFLTCLMGQCVGPAC